MFTNPQFQKNWETREPGGVSGSGLYDRGGAAGKSFAGVGWLSGEDDLACCMLFAGWTSSWCHPTPSSPRGISKRVEGELVFRAAWGSRKDVRTMWISRS